MGPWILIAAAAALPAAVEAAQASPAQGDAAERGVIAYPPAFFADARPVSAYDMVLRLPGFTFDKGVTVRGLAGSSGNVLIDGQPPVSKNDALDEILKRIPAAGVERVELIRGGAQGIDMEGRTILANVVRRQTAGFRAAVMPGLYRVYDGRWLPGVRAEAQWRWPGGRSAELAQVYGTGPNDEFGDGTRVRVNADGTTRLRSKVEADAYGLRAWTTGAYETPLFGGRARVNGALMWTPADVEIYDRYVGANGLEYEFDDIRRFQAELGGRFNRSLTERLTVEAVGFHQWNNQTTGVEFSAPGLTRDFLLDRESTEAVGKVHFRYRARPSLTLEAGSEGALNRLDSETSLSVNSRPVVVPAANVQVRERRGEVFAKGAWRPTATLTLEAGVRQELSRVTSKGDVLLEKDLRFTKPRAALTWAPDKASQVRVRIEREVGQLNFDDFVASPNVANTGTIVAGNPDLTPQQAWVYEAAYERRFWGGGAAVVTVRHYEITDVVDRVPILSPAGVILADAPGNIGAGTKDEAQASLTVPLDRFGIRAAQVRGQVTRRWTKVDDPLLGGTREISAARPVDWEAHFTQDLPQWKATWGVDLLGGWRERYFRLAEIETRKFSPWVVVYGEYKPRPDWIIRLEALGVSSRNVRRIREVHAGPRNLRPLDYTDIRSLEWDGSLYLRVRKLFGS
ncbi:MAG: TonB-dependent receptor [Phenylobacterium zucineum]|nr:MAG: TonB-dependent receptor [Phenylobacterium zucineum]